MLSSIEREERIMFFDDENTGMGSEVEETPATPATDMPADDAAGDHTEAPAEAPASGDQAAM